MSEKDEATRVRRLELVMQQVRSLPTLPAVAMRLLHLTCENGGEPRQVLEIIRHDPALTAQVLSMSRRDETPGRGPALTVEAAAEAAGVGQVRNAVLAVKVFPAFSDEETEGLAPPDHEGESDWHRFSFTGLWRHSLAVGVAAELIARVHGEAAGVDPAGAYVAGLLHDLGKLALAHLLPKSYARAAERAEWRQSDIAEAERHVIGMDHHTLGKRLAEHWRLPHLIQDCIWLHGTPWEALPELPHRRAVALIGVADLLVRRQQLGYSGNFTPADGLIQRARDAGLDPRLVTSTAHQVQDEVHRRCAALGIETPPTRQAFLGMVLSANETLCRGQARFERGARLLEEQSRALDAIREFHRHTTRPAVSVHDLLDAVAQSAAGALGPGYYALLHQANASEPWLLSQYASKLGPVSRSDLDPPPGLTRLSDWKTPEIGPAELMTLLPGLWGHLRDGVDVNNVRGVALPCGWGTSAVLMYDRPLSFESTHLRALASTWGAAVAAAMQHQGARRLGEQLVEAHRKLIAAQQEALHHQSLARVGQVAAGAAHEMNNPLAIISGRAQLLATQLPAGSTEQRYAEQIWRQSERLSDMITALRIFAEPPKPQIAQVPTDRIIDEALALSRGRLPNAPQPAVEGLEQVPPIATDPSQLAQALSELVVNAHEAQSRAPVRISASVDTENGRLILRVADDGVGMDAATLEHAFDPFFSAKPAGRQAGLGLARARRLVEGLGGDIRLSSRPNHGTTATLWVPLASSGQ